MQMWVYIVRRCLLVIPVVIGVMTILFTLVNALPPSDQLIAHFGAAGAKDPWVYNPTLLPGQGPCPANATQDCPNPILAHDLDVLGLNQPVPVRWAVYIYHSFDFQWGTVNNFSTATYFNAEIKDQPVTSALSWYLPYTLELALLSLGVILAISIPLGNLAAVHRNRPIDQAARILSFSGYAMPGFLLASLVLMGVVIFAGAPTGYFTHAPWCPGGELTYSEFTHSWPNSNCFSGGNYPGWLSGGGIISHPTGFPTVDAALHGQWWLAADTLVRMILPALVIAFGSIAVLLRFVRNSMLEVLNLDFVRTARAEGVPEKSVVRRHAGRNSLNVTITVLGLTFAFFLGGFPVIEYVFKLNGVGLMLTYAVQQGDFGGIDFGLVFGSTILFTFIIVAANIVVDILYAYLDPRVRLG